MVIGYINGMEIYYHNLCGKGAPLGGYFVTINIVGYGNWLYKLYGNLLPYVLWKGGPLGELGGYFVTLW